VQSSRPTGAANEDINMDQLTCKRAKPAKATVQPGYKSAQCSKESPQHWKCFVVKCSCDCHKATVGMRKEHP
jgi:hypothetical protein